MTNYPLPMTSDHELTSKSYDIVTSKSSVGRPRKCGKALETDGLALHADKTSKKNK